MAFFLKLKNNSQNECDKIKSGYSNDMIIESWLDLNGDDLVFCWYGNTQVISRKDFSTEIYNMTQIPNKNPSITIIFGIFNEKSALENE